MRKDLGLVAHRRGREVFGGGKAGDRDLRGNAAGTKEIDFLRGFFGRSASHHFCGVGDIEFPLRFVG